MWPIKPNKNCNKRKTQPTHNKTTTMLLLKCSDDVQDPELLPVRFKLTVWESCKTKNRANLVQKQNISDGKMED